MRKRAERRESKLAYEWLEGRKGGEGGGRGNSVPTNRLHPTTSIEGNGSSLYARSSEDARTCTYKSKNKKKNDFDALGSADPCTIVHAPK